ncbi:HET-domain-containing protein [Trametes cingulata]|nr:HET-domain-containing protein [Trametes cingulata]
MWLLNTTTYQLYFVQDPSNAGYAILSHVWNRAGEQTFQDLRAIHSSARRTFQQAPADDDPRLLRLIRERLSEKIRRCCDYARVKGVAYVWIDTCCIDKTSSAELSEAINSMFDWYSHAEVCYVFLADVSDEENPEADASSFRRSIWFLRGWTLQELIVPWGNVFLSKDWRMIGTKASLAKVIQQVTGIDLDILLRARPLHSVSVARRMSWASHRETTRVEDKAYCLMGIFGVRLPVMYGEGRQAFLRLQEEIMRRIPDQSLLSWGLMLPLDPGGELLSVLQRVPEDELRASSSAYLFASSPRDFQLSANFSPIPIGMFYNVLGLQSSGPPLYLPTSYGLRTAFPVHTQRFPIGDSFLDVQLAILACQDTDGRLPALILSAHDATWTHFIGGFKTTRHVSHILHSDGHVEYRMENFDPAPGRSAARMPTCTPSAMIHGASAQTIRRSPQHPRIALLDPSFINSPGFHASLVFQDVCIPYQRLQVESELTVFSRLPAQKDTGFCAPCRIFLPSWTLAHLRKCELTLEPDVTIRNGDMVPIYVFPRSPASHSFTLRHPTRDAIVVIVSACHLFIESNGVHKPALHASVVWASEDRDAGQLAERGPCNHVDVWEDQKKRFPGPSEESGAVVLQFSVWDADEEHSVGLGSFHNGFYALDIHMELPQPPAPTMWTDPSVSWDEAWT